MRKLAYAVTYLSVLALLVVGGAWNRLLQDLSTPHRLDGNEVVVDLPAGLSVAEFVSRLRERELIAESSLVDLFVSWAMRDPGLQAGEYALSPGASLLEQMEQVAQGRVVQHTVSFRPGMTAEDMAQRLSDMGLVRPGAFLEAVEDPQRAGERGLDTPSFRGFLLPDAYSMPKGRPATDLVQGMVDRFFEATEDARRSKALEDVSLREFVLMADRVQRASVPTKERRLYAALLHARRRAGLSLDEQLRPEQGSGGRPWVRFGTERQKEPLAWPPQGNPGIDALEAVANPARSAPKYLVGQPDGTRTYCEDLDCYTDAVRPPSQRYRPPPRPAVQVDPRAEEPEPVDAAPTP